MPPGVVQAEIDSDSGLLATPNCPHMETEYFLEGTQPTAYCQGHNLQQLPHVAGLDRIASAAPAVLAVPVSPSQQQPQLSAPAAHPGAATPAAARPAEKPNKKGFFGRIIGFIKGKPEVEEEPER